MKNANFKIMSVLRTSQLLESNLFHHYDCAWIYISICLLYYSYTNSVDIKKKRYYSMPWSILTNPYAVMTIIVSVILLTVPVIPVEDTEISYTFEPYTFEQSLVREEQIRKFPWIHEVTRAQYLIKNTDINGGIFYINCIFDND